MLEPRSRERDVAEQRRHGGDVVEQRGRRARRALVAVPALVEADRARARALRAARAKSWWLSLHEPAPWMITTPAHGSPSGSHSE